MLVSGTAAVSEDGSVLHPGDTYAQARVVLARALRAARELGAEPGGVIRTRLFLAPEAEWREAARAHAEALSGVYPANTTLFVHGFIPEGCLLEVELDAVVTEAEQLAGSSPTPY